MAPSAPLPDAAPTNWVDAYAPAALRPWLKLGRFDRPAGIWLLMLPGWQGIALAAAMRGRLPDPVLLLLFFLGAALMRAAGCAYNDIVDRDIDAKVARTAGRPIASGQISVKQAWACVIGCSLVSLLILLMLPPLCWLLGVLSLGLVAAYPFMKRITWWPQAWLGLTFNWGALMGYVAAASAAWLLLPPADALTHARMVLQGHWLSVQPGALPALLLYLGGVAWTLGYDTVYAIQDLEDDALAGVKSSARALGEMAPRAVLIFYAAAAALPAIAGVLAGLGPAFYAGLALYAAHLLAWQATRVRSDDPALALRIFRSNTWAGLILFAALAAGAL